MQKPSMKRSAALAPVIFVLIVCSIYSDRQDKTPCKAAEPSKNVVVLKIECCPDADLKITGLLGDKIAYAQKIVIERSADAKKISIVLDDSTTRTFELTSEQGLRKQPYYWDAIQPIKD